jgi:hypothetical protein
MLLDDTVPRSPRRGGRSPRTGIQNIRFFTQKNLYARRILTAWACARSSATWRHCADDQQTTADRLENRTRRATRHATWWSAICRCSPAATEKFREAKSARLQPERRDLERMRILVRAMAKRLAARYAKTRRRRLGTSTHDGRCGRTWPGDPFITVWKRSAREAA